MVLAYLGDQREESEIAELLGTTRRGTRLVDLTELQSWGYEASVTTGEVNDLDRLIEQNVPVIISVHTSQLPYYPLPPWDSHSVVVIGASRTGFTVRDPERADVELRLKRGSLQNAWAMRSYRMATIRLAR